MFVFADSCAEDVCVCVFSVLGVFTYFTPTCTQDTLYHMSTSLFL